MFRTEEGQEMRHWMMLVLLVCIVVMLPMPGSANDAQAWKELNHTANQVLKLTKEQRYEDGKRLMSVFADFFLSYDFEDQEWTMSSLRTLTTTFENAEDALTATNMPDDERIRLVTAFRLAIDAFAKNSEPLWKSTETQVMASLDDLEEAAVSKDAQALKRQINAFHSLYGMIRPSIHISTTEQTVVRFDSYFALLENQSVSPEQLEDHIETMRGAFKELYEGSGEDGIDPSLLWAILSIGGPLVASLSYVGYRKYRAEKRRVKAKE
ncbi:sporulation protein YpjB [Shouchella clausii]|nr:sporulation protein YpjB [Shouchella clausii]PAE84127.1 sporulation protein YpjB [Shouchella clausii]PAF05906.1 sporulation protein YpjB [Shouchella clausii]